MSRFKTSKYKNAFSYTYKQEAWINDCNVNAHLSSRGNLIDASREYVAFLQDSNGVSVLPVNSGGRFVKFPTISESATDLAFSPFHDRLLATGGNGCVRLWEVPSELPADTILVKPTGILTSGGQRVEMVRFHPTADNVLLTCLSNQVTVWDTTIQSSVYTLERHEDLVQCACWHGNGSMVATVCKKDRQKSIKLFDPRVSTTSVQEVMGHSSLKDSRVLWLGDSPYLLSSGADSTRNTEVAIWDTTNFVKPVSRVSLGTSASGTTMMFYDEDTLMVYVAVKNETAITFYELSGKTLSPGSHIHRSTQQIKGLALLPKATVDVMACQISRLMVLTQHAVVPISYHVQRKSHSEFHADLFPDTACGEPSMTANEWQNGANTPVARVSLDPARAMHSQAPSKANKKPDKLVESSKAPEPTTNTQSPVTRTAEPMPPVAVKEAPRPAKVMQLVRASKLRHVEGAMSHRSTTIDKLPPLNTTVPGDCNSFHANRDRAAAVIARPGGQMIVLELSKPGRLDTDSVPTLQHTADIMDFAFNPFDNYQIISACDDAYIRVWRVPDNGLMETLTEPQAKLEGHREKPNLVAFHPLASSVLASAGYDCKLLVWDLDTSQPAITITLKEPLFAMSWSPCGRYLATFSKNGTLSLYDPRTSPLPLMEGCGPEGRRGGRVIWLDSDHILVTGFTKSSTRTLNLYAITDLSTPKSVISLNISPATLMPTFDPDIKLLYVTGKGDGTVLVFEYVPDKHPYLFDVSPFSCPSSHQVIQLTLHNMLGCCSGEAVAFLPKVMCDVRKVEIARGVRLTSSTVDQFTIKVPRTRLEFFQDDLYPPTSVTWEPVMSSQEWLDGKHPKDRKTVELRPTDMKPLSEAPAPKQAPKKFESYNPKVKTDLEKKEELLSAMIERMGEKDDDPLPQSTVEGCDSDEWSD